MDGIAGKLVTEEPFTLYVLTFFSLFFAFIAAEFLAGCREVFHNRSQSTASLLHLSWALLLFLLVLENWWGLWRYRRVISGSFPGALLIMLNLILLSLCVWALFPKHQPQDRLHWQNRLFENQRIFTGIAAILLLKFSFDAALLAGDALLSRPNFVRWSAAVILLALGFMPRRPRTHWAAIFVLAGLFSYFVVLEHL